MTKPSFNSQRPVQPFSSCVTVAADDAVGLFSKILHTSGLLQRRDEAVREANAELQREPLKLTALQRQVRSQHVLRRSSPSVTLYVG